MKNHIKEILFALADANIRFVLAGGVAVVLHGVERVTLDVDIALDMKEENVVSFLDVISKLGLIPRAPVPAEILLDGEARDMMVNEKHAVVFTFIDLNDPLRQLDVFLALGCQFGDLAGDSVVLTIDGRRLSVVSRGQLIQMKKSVKPMRSKDRMDVEELEKLG